MNRIPITNKKQAKAISLRQRTKGEAFVSKARQIIENHPNNLITTNEALKMVKEIGEMNITLKTLLTWIVKYKMGRKIGGRWAIYRSVFLKFLNEGSESV